MNRTHCLHVLAAAISLFAVSCGDDPKLVEKREKQKTEITRLKGELALVEEKLKNLPPDVSDELSQAKDLSEKQNAEIAALEAEVASLEKAKSTLDADFQKYRSDYRVK